MAEFTLFGKRRLCFTKLEDFTNFQGIGSDPLYKRYESVFSVVSTHIPEQYIDFFAHPMYDENRDCITWYLREWEEEPRMLKDLSGEEKEHYHRIFEETKGVYERVRSGLSRNEDKVILTGALKYISEEFVFCYDNKVSLIAWGMAPEEDKHTVIGGIIHDLNRDKLYNIVFLPGENGVLPDIISSRKKKKFGMRLTAADLPKVEAKSGYSFREWSPNPLGMKVERDMEFVALYDIIIDTPMPDIDKVRVSFVGVQGCRLVGETSFVVDKGTVLAENQIPEVEVEDSYTFRGWEGNIYEALNGDVVFRPILDKGEVNCKFIAGEHGTINGVSDFNVLLPFGTTINNDVIPNVKAKKGYKFVGWDKSPIGCLLNGDSVFVAQYEPVVPWYKRFWLWFIGKGCLRTLLWFLLMLLLLLLLIWLFKDCSGCTRNQNLQDGYSDNDSIWVGSDPNVGNGGIYSPDDPYRALPTDPVNGDMLPPFRGVLPPVNEGDIEPGNPSIISNRLNVLMENNDKSIVDLAKAFKQHYPGEQYKVIYYDDAVKRMQIMIPRDERETIKQELPTLLSPEFEVFVFDESLFESRYTPNDPIMSNQARSWYLQAVNAPEAWDITMGSEDVVVAVVDNGFSLSHPELSSKVVRPYNVWTHSSDITAGREDHGTHVAGLALAIGDNNEGICGIAPKCRFMPIQVADRNGVMTTTSVLDGILYALYQGADVVNISLGCQFVSMSGADEAVQRQFMKFRMKEEERLWREIARIASSHKTTLVVAAGNDNILAGVDAIQRPGEVIVVSAVDKNMSRVNKATFSNYGEYSTVSAPGVSMYSSVGRNGYKSMDGTSMAAPIVTGAIALMKSINPTITTKQIKCALRRSSKLGDGKIGGLIQIDKALSVVKSGDFSDCVPVPTTGDVQVKLSWNNYNDLDLYCVDPYGEVVWFKNKVVGSGGLLEIDMNVEYPDSKTPIENIYWPTGEAPFGTYTVYVAYYKQYETNASTPYNVMVKCGDKVTEYEGQLSREQERVKVCTFELNGDGSGGSNAMVDRREELTRQKAELERALRMVNDELTNLRN